MPLIFTPPMEKRLTPRVRHMLEVSLLHFPELKGETITVGYTRGSLGAAVLSSRNGSETSMGIRLKVRNLVYNTIGHELTHLVQGLSHLAQRKNCRDGRRIPAGEKPCDIWTLARSGLFCDDAPTYIRLPREVRGDWPRFAKAVRLLCIAAIEKRRAYRCYIRWLEGQIRQLAREGKEEGDEGDLMHGLRPYF